VTLPKHIIWQKTYQVETLAGDEVHLWLIRFRPDKEEIEELLTVLSGEEKERAAHYHFDKDRDRFIFAHGYLRILLGQYLGKNPTEFKFFFNEHGKPHIRAADGSSPFRFNVSHSADLSLLGVTRKQEIGVDLERIRPDFSYDEIIRQFFSAQEIARIHAQPEALKRESFYRFWTLKEACLKAQGTGLSESLSRVQDLSIKNNRLIFPAGGRERKAGYRCFARQFFPEVGYVATVVVCGRVSRVEYFEWAGQVGRSQSK